MQTYVMFTIWLMAVLCRNPTLFHCILRLCYRVRNAVAQNFRCGWRSYMLHTLIRYWCTYVACMRLALNRSFALQHFERGNAVEIHSRIMFNFYVPGTATLKSRLYISQRPLWVILVILGCFFLGIHSYMRLISLWKLFCSIYCTVLNALATSTHL